MSQEVVVANTGKPEEVAVANAGKSQELVVANAGVDELPKARWQLTHPENNGIKLKYPAVLFSTKKEHHQHLS